MYSKKEKGKKKALMWECVVSKRSTILPGQTSFQLFSGSCSLSLVIDFLLLRPFLYSPPGDALWVSMATAAHWSIPFSSITMVTPSPLPPCWQGTPVIPLLWMFPWRWELSRWIVWWAAGRDWLISEWPPFRASKQKSSQTEAAWASGHLIR